MLTVEYKSFGDRNQDALVDCDPYLEYQQAMHNASLVLSYGPCSYIWFQLWLASLTGYWWIVGEGFVDSQGRTSIAWPQMPLEAPSPSGHRRQSLDGLKKLSGKLVVRVAFF